MKRRHLLLAALAFAGFAMSACASPTAPKTPSNSCQIFNGTNICTNG